MRFTNSLWAKIEPLYDKIISHPFNVELAQGTLDVAKFKYYVQQDSLYLLDYSRALALVGAKAPTSNRVNDFLAFAKDGMWVEEQLHQTFFKQFSITPAEDKQPGCFAYTNFLLAECAAKPYEVGVASLLPCFWIYREVGMNIVTKSVPNNPFQDWINTYSGDEFRISVTKAIEIVDEAADSASTKMKEEMTKSFMTSTKLEWIFWDAAYNLKQWDI